MADFLFHIWVRRVYEMERNNFWGYHLILDCSFGNKSKVTDPKHITKFAKTLVEQIDMIAYGEPQVVHFAEHKPEVAGYTLVQLIQTSSITCHFVDSTGSFYLDVFSCKTFSIGKVQEIVQEFFNPESTRVTYITRQA